MNSSVHSSTGVSPASLLFGDAINLDRGIFIPMEVVEESKTLSQWSSDMLQTQLKLIHIAELRQISKDDSHIEKNAVEEVTVFEPNSFVLVSYPDGAMGPRPPSKLHTNLRGPLRVLSHTGPHYKLYNLVDDKEEIHHVKALLQPYHYDSQQGLQPSAVALKDKGEFKVESILRHTGDPKRKSEMDFLVRWEGYDATHDLWLPWSSLRNNPKLHVYLRSNGLARLIPKEHR